MSDKDIGVNIGLEHLLAGAIHANGGKLVYDIENILTNDIVDKQFRLVVEDGVVTVTLVDSEEE